MSAVHEINPGDWVLVEHRFLYDAYEVRRVVSATKSKSKFVGERLEHDRLDGPQWVQDNARNRSKIAGVFPGENAAIAAKESLRALFAQKNEEEKAARARFHAAAQALLDPS